MTPQMHSTNIEAMLDFIAKQAAETTAYVKYTAEATHATAQAVRTIKAWVVFLGVVSVLGGGMMALLVLGAIAGSGA